MDKQLPELRRLGEKMPNYREVMELAEKIFLEKQRVKIAGTFPPISLDSVKARIQLQEGFPYLRPAEIPLDPAWTGSYFFHLLEVFKQLNPAKHEALRKSLETHGFVFDQFLRRLLENRPTEIHFAEEWGDKGSLLLFFLVQSLKPTFEFHAANWRMQQKELSFAQGFCPFCGGLPGLAEIREEGRRVLHCPLCATEWEYPRMKCVYCQNEDQEKLTSFQIEGEVGYRVDICLNCQQYLKTIDAREREGSRDWEIEDYLTLHLDYLAQQEGYGRPEGLFVEIRQTSCLAEKPKA